MVWICSILWKMVKSNFSLRPQTSMIISSKETLNVVVLEFKKVCCWNPWSWRKKDDDKWKYHQKCWFSDVFKAFVKQPFLISQHDKFRNVENFHLQWSSNTYKLFSVDKRMTSCCNSKKSFGLPFCSKSLNLIVETRVIFIVKSIVCRDPKTHYAQFVSSFFKFFSKDTKFWIDHVLMIFCNLPFFKFSAFHNLTFEISMNHSFLLQFSHYLLLV